MIAVAKPARCFVAAVLVFAGLTASAWAADTTPPPAAAAPAAAAPTAAAVTAAGNILGAIGIKEKIALVVPGMMAELERNVTNTRPEIRDSLRQNSALDPARVRQDRATDLRRGCDASRLGDVREGASGRGGVFCQPARQEISRDRTSFPSEARCICGALAAKAFDRHPHTRPRGDEEEGRRILKPRRAMRPRA